MMEKADLQKAYDGSYYTIAGCGGDLNEWVEGYEEWLAEAGVGKPVEWLITTGADVNRFRLLQSGGTRLFPDDEFEGALTFLMFPLDGLGIGKLALFKMEHGDRWFDDVISNMRVVEI